jgi:transposase-like protein
MNSLDKGKILVVLNALLEGQSIRSVERITGIHRDTITRWMVRAGDACESIHDKRVRHVQARYIQADEMWSFIGKKDAGFEYQGNVTSGHRGEAWVYVALDADSKLVLSYRLGSRDQENAFCFLRDLRERVLGDFQLTTDGFSGYVLAAYRTMRQGVSYGQLVKAYEGNEVSG